MIIEYLIKCVTYINYDEDLDKLKLIKIKL